MKKLQTTKKITRATLKSFIKRNLGSLYLDIVNDHSGYSIFEPKGFQVAKEETKSSDHNLGIVGLWTTITGDELTLFEDDKYVGIKIRSVVVNNVIAVKK